MRRQAAWWVAGRSAGVPARARSIPTGLLSGAPHCYARTLAAGVSSNAAHAERKGRSRKHAHHLHNHAAAGADEEKEEGSRLAEERTRQWAESMVVGLRLCPFARLDETRVVCAPAEASADMPDLIAFLRSEIDVLRQRPDVASTLVVLPHAGYFEDFETFNAAVNVATEELSTDENGDEVETIHQIAQFHPRFRYADVEEASVENYTSRSPYPTVHLIRASLITAAREKLGEEYLLQIPEANSRRLRNLGLKRVRALCPRPYQS